MVVNDFLKIDTMDADEVGDEVMSESTRKEEVIKDIEVESELEADEIMQEEYEPLVEGGEDNPTKEENNEKHEKFSVEPRETYVEPSGDNV